MGLFEGVGNVLTLPFRAVSGAFSDVVAGVAEGTGVDDVLETVTDTALLVGAVVLVGLIAWKEDDG